MKLCVTRVVKTAEERLVSAFCCFLASSFQTILDAEQTQNMLFQVGQGAGYQSTSIAPSPAFEVMKQAEGQI